MTRLLITLPLLALATACGSPEPAADNVAVNEIEEVVSEALPAEDMDAFGNETADGAPETDAWIGRWVGVEGLAIDVQPRGDRTAGLYDLTISTMDGTDSYEGRAAGEVIEFERDGETVRLRAVSGDETGLRYLAGKQNCLMTVEAEGFCRD